jgi:DNA-binding NarL/FixJ family response regulator
MPPEDPVGPRPVRVVTVDDQDMFRRAAQAVIESSPGFTLVGESTSGEDALRLIPETDPDMVILDVRMRGLDGIQVAERLRSEDPTRVVVLASSADSSTLGALARSCGAAALVRKQWLTPRLLRGLWIAHRRR